jgi:uncharacterized protein (TIGR02266 family)
MRPAPMSPPDVPEDVPAAAGDSAAPSETPAETSAEAEKRRSTRAPVTLLVEYDGADDLIGDYTENLSSGGIFVGTTRPMEIGAPIRLALSFPGLLAPIAVAGVVRWVRTLDPDDPTIEPGIGIEFEDGPARARLAGVIDRLRARDPGLVVRTVRVLVVEDNPLVASLIQEGLRGATRRGTAERAMSDLAFQFRTAVDGRGALELLRAEPFDALIIDCYLPHIDGPSVIATARGELGLVRLPIIAVSAGGPTAKAAALKAGANMFIDKPMRLRQVIDTMRALIDAS